MDWPSCDEDTDARTRAADDLGQDGGATPARALRILIVHNRYQIRGGEDTVVDREIESLARAGQTIETVLLDNHAIGGRLDQLRVAWQAPRAPAGIAAVLAAADRFGPDVVHVHNTFPLISPAVHGALRARGFATVQTLHNFRVVCANGLLMRDGKPCERCLTGSPFNAVPYACFRGSRMGSLAVARMIDRHRRAGTWRHDVDRFIALTDFARDRFVAAGLPADLIRVKPNGMADPGPPPPGRRSGILYVGRLSQEKGIAVLATAAAAVGAPVTAIGVGPLEPSLLGRPNLTLVGRRSAAEVRAAMETAAAVVVPSLCYEGLPMVIPEAFAAGTPVVASRIGAMAELIRDGETGLHAIPGDPASLAQALNRLLATPTEAARMGGAARAAYLRDWTDAAVTRRALAIYRDAIAARRAAAVTTTIPAAPRRT